MKRKTRGSSSRSISTDLIRLEEQFRAHVESEEKWQETVTERLDTVIGQLTPIVQTNNTILLGVPNTDNKGVVGDMKIVKEYVAKDERRWAKLIGAASVVSAAISVFIKEVFR